MEECVCVESAMTAENLLRIFPKGREWKKNTNFMLAYDLTGLDRSSLFQLWMTEHSLFQPFPSSVHFPATVSFFFKFPLCMNRAFGLSPVFNGHLQTALTNSFSDITQYQVLLPQHLSGISVYCLSQLLFFHSHSLCFEKQNKKTNRINIMVSQSSYTTLILPNLLTKV